MGPREQNQDSVREEKGYWVDDLSVTDLRGTVSGLCIATLEMVK